MEHVCLLCSVECRASFHTGAPQLAVLSGAGPGPHPARARAATQGHGPRGRHHQVSALSALPRVINTKSPLQLHQKYYTTQYGELGFS